MQLALSEYAKAITGIDICRYGCEKSKVRNVGREKWVIQTMKNAANKDNGE